MPETDAGAGTFGARMKHAREARAISLRQIAAATKISVAALEALERNDISRLPGGIFSRAFVRSYAAQVGLDPEQTVREFMTQFPHDSVTAGSPHVPQEDHTAIEGSRRSAETALKLLGISLPIAGVILYLTLQYRPADPSVDEPVPGDGVASERSTGPRPSGAIVEVAPPADVPASTDTVGAMPLPVGAEPLTFEIVATSRVDIAIDVDGVRREARAVAAGERVVVTAEREMTLTMGDAGAVQLTINGQPAVSLGRAGESRAVQIGRRNYGAFLASQ